MWCVYIAHISHGHFRHGSSFIYLFNSIIQRTNSRFARKDWKHVGKHHISAIQRHSREQEKLLSSYYGINDAWLGLVPCARKKLVSPIKLNRYYEIVFNKITLSIRHLRLRNQTNTKRKIKYYIRETFVKLNFKLGYKLVYMTHTHTLYSIIYSR